MRRLLFAAALVLCSHAAHADTVADLQRPSSTVAGCVNQWGAFGDGNGEQTCEGKAALVEWNEQAAAVDMARDIIGKASDLPDRADVHTVINALNECAAAADAMARINHSEPPLSDPFADMLAWMRPNYERLHLKIPASVSDGFRIIAGALENPYLLRIDRNTLYGQAAVFAIKESEIGTEQVQWIPRPIDKAVYRVHQAALQAAHAVEHGKPPADAGRDIEAAAGPDYPALGHAAASQFDRSMAAHPDEGGYSARTGRALRDTVGSFLGLIVLVLIFEALTFRRAVARSGAKKAVENALLLLGAIPISWLPLALLHAVTGWPDGWLAFVIWLGLLAATPYLAGRFLPDRMKRLWRAVFSSAARATHGTARFGGVSDARAADHLAPARPADGFALGVMADAPPGDDPRFWQDGHILTCAPTGAGKGVGAVIPNLLDYPGSAFVLDIKGENYAVTARARREAGQEVYLIDPFGITGTPGQSMNWLDVLNPDDPDVVSLSAALADMLIVSSGESDPHWNDTAKELLRGFLVYVACLPDGQRTMAELRRLLTGFEADLTATLEDMLSDPERGQRLVYRAATAHLNRPLKERGSVLSTVVRHTAWLDDPRLCACLGRSDFSLRDLKQRPMTVYLAIPPDRFRACLGFVRGFIGLGLDAMTASQARPAHRVAFFLDEFGQLGRMDRLADGITLLRGYGVQLWLFIQDLSQLKAVYPRWQSFLANTIRQFFGTADYDTARFISESLGQHTITFQTESTSYNPGAGLKPGTVSRSSGEHVQGRSLLTPDEVMRLGSSKLIVMASGEPPYLLERLNYLADPVYRERFDANPMHRAG